MEPMSILTGCASLISTLGSTVIGVTSFIRECREAKTDMMAVIRELSEFKVILTLLQDTPAFRDEKQIAPKLREQISSVLNSSYDTINRVERVVAKYSGGKTGSMMWAVSGKEEVSKIQSSLEAHRDSLHFLLELLSV